MPNCRLSIVAVLCAGFLGTVAGCGGGSDAPELGQVTGTVTLDDKPLEGATVTFMPENSRASSGTTDASGKYVLTYIRDQTGAAIGKHKVIVTKMVDERNVLPAIYSDEEKTPLSKDVEAGENLYDIPLKSKPGRK